MPFCIFSLLTYSFLPLCGHVGNVSLFNTHPSSWHELVHHPICAHAIGEGDRQLYEVMEIQKNVIFSKIDITSNSKNIYFE